VKRQWALRAGDRRSRGHEAHSKLLQCRSVKYSKCSWLVFPVCTQCGVQYSIQQMSAHLSSMLARSSQELGSFQVVHPSPAQSQVTSHKSQATSDKWQVTRDKSQVTSQHGTHLVCAVLTAHILPRTALWAA